MRTLTANEVHVVAGSGFGEDISAISSVIYVGNFIATFTKGAVLFALNGSFDGKWGGNVANAAGFAAPLLIAQVILSTNPQMVDSLVAKYHEYFG